MDVKDIPKDPKIKKICPMTLPRPDGPFACCEGQCAWWKTYYKGQEHEYSECSINALSLIGEG